MRKRSGKALLTVLITIVVVLAVLAGTFLILTRTGKSVAVAYTAADLQTYQQKTGVVFDSKSAGYEAYIKGTFKGVGSKAVNGTVTNAELSAIINKTASETGFANDFAIRFTTDGVTELSFTMGKNLDVLYNMVPEAKKYEKVLKLAAGMHIYYKMDIDYLGNDQFKSVSKELYVGQIPLPIDQVNTETTPIGTQVNSIIKNIDGLEIKSLDFLPDGLKFDGTIPESVIDTSK